MSQTQQLNRDVASGNRTLSAGTIVTVSPRSRSVDGVQMVEVVTPTQESHWVPRSALGSAGPDWRRAAPPTARSRLKRDVAINDGEILNTGLYINPSPRSRPMDGVLMTEVELPDGRFVWVPHSAIKSVAPIPQPLASTAGSVSRPVPSREGRDRSARRLGLGLLPVALLGLILAIVGNAQRAHYTGRRFICNSGLGQFGQSVNATAHSMCSSASTHYYLGWTLIVVGALVCLGIGWLAVSLIAFSFE